MVGGEEGTFYDVQVDLSVFTSQVLLQGTAGSG